MGGVKTTVDAPDTERWSKYVPLGQQGAPR